VDAIRSYGPQGFVAHASNIDHNPGVTTVIDSYPTPNVKLMAICETCRLTVGGGQRGSFNFRFVLKAIKRHEDDEHSQYDRDRIIPALVRAVEERRGKLP